MKRVLSIFMTVLLCLSLCACHQEEPLMESQREDAPSTAPSSPLETTAPSLTETTAPPTTEEPTTESIPPSTQPPSEGTPLNAEELAGYQELLTRRKDYDATQPKNWYNVAMCMEFDTPESLDWNILFYNGTGDEEEPLTADERSYLEQMGFPEELDVVRLSPAKMDEIAQQYFGMTMDSSYQVGVDELTYFSQTGCYYRYVSDVMSMSDFTIYEGYVLENGDIRLYYTDNILQWKLAMTLRSKGTEEDPRYWILSNCRIENG